MKVVLTTSLIIVAVMGTALVGNGGDQVVPWHSSCKECTDGSSCSSWDVFMFLNSTSNLWEYCPDGEFYNYSLKIWQSWGSSWDGLWSYQSSCYDCLPGEVLDLDSFTWVSAWDADKHEISDNSNFNLAKFWRNTKFYIDPTYDDIIELGTQRYPYRTLLPAFDEILLHFSNSNATVEVYIKENTINFIEDSKTFVINMTSVLVTTYNDTSAPAGYATIYSIDSSQEKISSKAAFHLAKNTVVDLDPIITGKGFSENELSQIGKNKATFEVVRTSITVQNILVRRVAASTTTGMFMFLIYLQQKSMRLSKSRG